jgi:hypothetical protein
MGISFTSGLSRSSPNFGHRTDKITLCAYIFLPIFMRSFDKYSIIVPSTMKATSEKLGEFKRVRKSFANDGNLSILNQHFQTLYLLTKAAV